MADSQPSAQKIALLARIELTDEESAKVQSEFDSILNYIPVSYTHLTLPTIPLV